MPMADQPWQEVRVYQDGQQLREMRSIKVTLLPGADGLRISVRNTVNLSD